MLSAEGIGKSVEKAVENALLELRATREDVDIKVLDEGGFLKKAKVIVTISEDSKHKYVKKIRPNKPDEEEIESLDVKAMFAELKGKPVEGEKTTSLKKDKGKIEKTREKSSEKKAQEERSLEIKEQSKKMTAKDFLKGLLAQQSIEGSVFLEENEDTINIYIEGGNSGELIGHRGECLNAIQYITSIIENNSSGTRKRIIVDIEKYRSRREESLKGLANRIAKKVEKTNKSIKLEPMNAGERRIIHTELQSSHCVTTISKGTEPHRFIIVLPNKQEEAGQ